MPFVVIVSIHGDPGGRYETREQAFAVIEGMVRHGIAAAGAFTVVERDSSGQVVGEPFGAPSDLEDAGVVRD
jgi:hypothetical protein